MDMNTFNSVGGSLGIVSIIVSILTYFNHRRFRSNCCGKKLEASIDVDQTTPPSSVRLVPKGDPEVV
jgi:hypothetical protein